MTLRPYSVALAVALALAPSAGRAADSGNLLVDGDFAAARCTDDWSAITTIPGWSVVRGGATVMCAAALPAAPPPGLPGAAFLANGPYGDMAISQTVDLTGAGGGIDGGHARFTLSAALGGAGDAAGQAEVSVTFFDAYDDPMPGAATLGGVDAAARGHGTGFLARSVTGQIPARARRALVRARSLGAAPLSSSVYVGQIGFSISTALPAPAPKRPRTLVPAFDHVFMIMMENTDAAAVIGDTVNAPYINTLARQGALFAAHSGVYHPSDQNYLAIAGGATFVKGPIYFPNIHVPAPHLGDRVEAVGKTWKSYEQGMGTPCNLASDFDENYAPDDAPFINFANISGNPARCAEHLFDTTQLTTDLQSAATTPNFAWIAADYYFDGELPGDGSPKSLQVQDRWLKRTLKPIFASPAWTDERSLLILTWDESAAYDTNHVAAIVMGSQGLVRAGVQSYVASNHYGIARTIEGALGLTPLTRNDTQARPLNEAFSAQAAQPTLSARPATVARGARVSAAYSTPLASYAVGNAVQVLPAGQSPGQAAALLSLRAADQGGTLSLDTRALPAGAYAVWYVYDDGATPLAAPQPLTVTP